ncbi:flagellar filament capping protein FliD [Planctomycetota bacterium]
MGTLNFPGLATGVDTSSIVKQLMAVNSRSVALMQLKKVGYKERQDALNDVKSKTQQLKNATSSLADASNLETFTTSSSDTARLSISANEEAKPGSHSVRINQLATSETWLQDISTFDYESDYVGAGTFIYSYNYQERVITTTATTTVEDLVGLINNDEDNPGITASLLNQGDKYHLMLSGHDTGEDYQISLNSSTTETWKPNTGAANHTFTESNENATLSTKLVDLDQWGGVHTGSETITISGKNHDGTTILPARTLTISDDTSLQHLIKEINYHFEGFATARLENGQIVLTDHTAGASNMEISLSYADNGGGTLGLPTMAVSTEGGSTSASIAALDPSSFVQTQNAQNAKIKIDNYTPTATAEVQTLTPDVVATAGTYTLSYGSDTANLNWNDDASAIQTALNALDSITAIGGVTVSGNGLNAGGDLTITFASAADNVNMLTVNPAGLTGTSSVTVAETTRGNNEAWISRNANVISDAVTGLTFSLQDVNDTNNDGDPIDIEITVSRNNRDIEGKLHNLSLAYNNLLNTLKEKTEYNDQTKEMGILSDDIAVTLIKTQMKQPFIGVVDGFSGVDALDESSDLGISFDGRGEMQIDQSILNDALEDNFAGVVDLLGAVAKGNTDSSTIEFNQASERYTRAGTYDVQVTVTGGAITSAKIKLQSEGDYRDMTIDGNLVSGNASFQENGYTPLYAENGLYLQVDLSSNGTFTSTLRVKQGFAGQLDEALDDIAKTNGRLDLSQEILTDRSNYLDRLIQQEQARLYIKPTPY